MTIEEFTKDFKEFYGDYLYSVEIEYNPSKDGPETVQEKIEEKLWEYNAYVLIQEDDYLRNCFKRKHSGEDVEVSRKEIETKVRDFLYNSIKEYSKEVGEEYLLKEIEDHIKNYKFFEEALGPFSRELIKIID